VEELITIEAEIRSLSKERLELMEKYVGGHDILRIEKRIEELEKEAEYIAQELNSCLGSLQILGSVL